MPIAIGPSTGATTRTPPPPSNGQHDFVRITEASRKSVVCLVYGMGGTGKTTFVTRYCPPPIRLINLDGRCDGAVLVDQANRAVTIDVAKVDYDENILQMSNDQAMATGAQVFDRFMCNFDEALRRAKVEGGTTAIDTGTELDDIMQYMTRGRLDQAGDDYGKSKKMMKRQWWSMVQRARSSGGHLVILARAKEAWMGGKVTDVLEPEALCSKTMVDAVDWAGNIAVTRKSVGGMIPSATTGETKFSLTITKAGDRISELLQTYTEDQWGSDGPFVYACQRQFPNYPVETWR